VQVPEKIGTKQKRLSDVLQRLGGGPYLDFAPSETFSSHGPG